MDWRLGLLLILLFGTPRFLLVMEANVSGKFNLVSIVFILMCITPWILLTKEGRKKIGIKKPTNWSWVFPAFVFGVAFCLLVFFIGRWLFFNTNSNWFIYLSKPYQVVAGTTNANELFLKFIIFAIIGMTFSPFGEEFLYRGLIHQSFVDRYGEHGASVIDSSAFAITHLAHFGIVYVSGMWKFLLLPALIWLIFMFFASRLFYFMKQKTGSIFGAVISHAGFNLTMSYLMIYYVVV